MKTTEILGLFSGLFLMIGVYYGFNLAEIILYVFLTLAGIFAVINLYNLSYYDASEVIQVRDEFTLRKLLTSWIMIAGWVYTLLQTNNTQLLYFFVGYQIIVYTFIIRLFTKQEEN